VQIAPREKKPASRTLRRPSRKQSLRWRLLALLAVVLLVTLFTIGASVYRFAFLVEQGAWRGRQREATRNAVETVAAFIHHIEHSLTLVSLLDREYLTAEPQVMRDLLRQDPGLLEIVRLDARGHVFANVSQDVPLLANLFTIPQSNWFLRASAGELYLGNIQVSSSGEPYLIVALPAPDGGVVAARLRMTVLWDLVAAIRFGKTGQAYVVNRDGRIVAHSRPEVVLAKLHVTEQPDLDVLARSPDHPWSGAYVNLEGKRVVGTVAPVSGTGWGVITELSEAEAYAVSRTALLLLSVGMLLFGVVVMLVTSHLLGEQIFRPIETLRAGVERIGEGDLGHRIDIARRDEIGQVAAAFNEMAGRLRERNDQLAARTAALVTEVVERKRAEEALRELNETLEQRVAQRTTELRESEERYALAARGANDGLWDWDLRSNQIYFSPRWKAMLGYEESEVGNSPDEWFRRVHPEDLEQVNLDISAHLEGLNPHFGSEHRVQHKDGTYRWVLCRGLAVRDADGVAYRMAGSQTDITDRKRAEEQLIHDAFHDALTGLPNRALFMDRLSLAVERAKRSQDHLFAVLFLDLDRFKLVNDSLGHTLGDQLLITVARRLKTCLRTVDTAARLGGDEFVILLDDIEDAGSATRVAERVLEVLALPSDLNGHEAFITASIGIVLSETGYERADDILRDTDIAMYRAKALGRARYVVFDAAMRATALARMDLETGLRRAFDRHEFRLYYQPIVSLATGRIAGLEALLRWQHPERGLIAPAEFIPVAEETELILPIGLWVLREACRQMHQWQTKYPAGPPLTISVNLSSKQVTQPDLPAQVEQILAETGLDARSLVLEVTESAIMDDAEIANAVLSELKAMGIQVQMDDFGTGYSSLSYLHQLPIDAIKVDHSFISTMNGNSDNSYLVPTIIALAHDLGMETVAEGIETADQLAQLGKLGCEWGQGYYLFRPLDSESAEALIAKEMVAL
jgi:diguanylate cyclase (GGDEF)-like protein/PAS domain S-box-containing protein